MKKVIFVLSVLMMTCTASFASPGQVERVFNADVIAGTGKTVVSRTFNLSSIDRLGYWMRLDQGVTAGQSAIALYLEMSYDDTNANFATVSTVTSNNTQGRGTVNTITYQNMKYGRFRATGLATQATDSTITMYVFTQDRD